MFFRYLANTVENNTGVFSTGEELLIARTRTHTHAHTHTNKNIQENKQNKKNRTPGPTLLKRKKIYVVV